MRNTKKILGIVLALIVLTLVMSISVFAATTVTTEEDLTRALTAGGEVTLGGNVEVTTEITIPADVTVTLDLAGYSINGVATSDTRHVYPLRNNGVLTIKDSVGTGSITGRGIYNGTDNADNSGVKLTIDGATVNALDWNGGACVWSYGGEVYLNNASMTGCTGVVSANGYLEINGGTYVCYSGIDDNGTEITSPTYNIRAYNGLKITDGTFTSRHGVISLGGGTGVIEDGSYTIEFYAKTTGNVVYVYGDATLTINGGEFISDNANGTADSGTAVSVNGTSAVTINDGTFVGMSDMVSVNDKTVINGGNYDTVWDYNNYSNIDSAVATGAVVTVGGETVVKNEDGGTTAVVALVNGVGYETFDEAIAAANALTGDVTVEIYGKVEYSAATANLTGAYDSISFVGKTSDAEISITRDGSGGYISGDGNDCTVNFTDLILSKPTGAYAGDAGFMNVYFTVYRVGAVNYTNCTFPDGACAQGCPVTYTDCNFANQTSGEYSLWVYANTTVTVTDSEFTGVRGAKMYGEGQSKTGNLVMTNTTFAESVTEKPAIVLTYGQSVTLDENTYPAKGTFELDLDGSPNGTTITVDAEENITCVNDKGDCGVLVDGKIYTTVAQAAEVATSGSTVTLLHDSTEEVELAEGVTLDTNGYTAENVTVAVSGPVEVATYDDLVAALNAGKDVVLTADIVCTGEINGTDVEIDLNGKKLTLTVGGTNFYGESVVSNGTIDITGCVASGDCIIGIGDYIIGIGDYSNNATLNNVNIVGDGYSSAYAILYVYGASTLNINGGSIVVANDNAEAGGVIKGHSAANGKINITGTENDPVELSFTNAQIGILDGTVVLDTVDLDITGGANAINGSALTVKNSTVTITGCNGRAITPNQGDVVIENSTLDLSNCTEGEIRFKKSLTMTVDASSTISECTIYADSTATEAKVNDVAVVGTEDSMATVTVANGTTTIKAQPQGTLNIAYISSAYVNGVPAIFGEAVGVIGEESFVVKLYCGETLVGTATLVDNDKVLLNGNSVSVTWHAALSSDGDTWWSTEWTDGSLKVNAIPDTAVLYVDGEQVSTCEVQMNINDLKNPIVAAKVDANGVIEGFVVSAGYLNGVNENVVQYAAALNEAFKQSGNYVLVRDITLTETVTIPEGTEVVLDLAGFDITADNDNVNLDVKGTLTVNDSVGGGVSTFRNHIVAGELVLNGGTLQNISTLTAGFAVNINGGKLTVNGGTIQSVNDSNYAIGTNYGNPGEIVINDGTINGNLGCVSITDGTVVTINGGTFNVTGEIGGHCVYVSNGTVTIKGGYYNTYNESGTSVTSYSVYANGDSANVTITNGTFEADIYGRAIGASAGTIAVSGGTFYAAVPEEFCADGFVCQANEDGTYSVAKIVASVTDDEGNVTNYATLSDALTAAKEMTAPVVKMLSDVEISATAVRGNITLDLNGCTILANQGYNKIALQLKSGASLTVIDTSAEQDGLIKADFVGGGRAIDMPNSNTTFTLVSGNIWSSEVGVYAGDSTATITIQGGSVKCDTANADSCALDIDSGSATVTGGIFSHDVSNYCADGFVCQANEDGTYGVVEAKAQIGDVSFASVADALAYAQEQNITDLVITLIGNPSKDDAVSLDDAFDLYMVSLFDSVTIKQADVTTPYYIAGLYTGSRTNGGTFVFDGVNIVVTDQYIFEGNVKLTNNSVIKSVTEANCFLYYSEVTIEPGSKLQGIIEDLRGGTLIVDGGRTDGGYNETPDMQDSILTIRWSGDSITIKNGAYVKVNSANEVGRVTITSGTSLNVYDSKLDSYQWIANDGTINLDINSIITTGKITGAGKIVIDASEFNGTATQVINADMSEFTGTVEIINNNRATYEITDSGIVVKNYAVMIGDVGYMTIDAALNAVKSGETITLLQDVALTSVVELKDVAITIEGNYTITINDADDNNLLKVYGETSLKITSTVTGEVWLDDGAILKDSYISGNVFVAGNVTFRGANSVAMLYDFGVLTSNYGTSAPMAWTVEKGASLEIRDKARYGLGYGDSVTIYGTIEDALTARENLTEGDVAFFVHGLVAQESSGWNKNNYFTVEDAYVVIGSNNSFGNKPGNYGGKYSFVFNNTVLDASRITFYEATSKTELSFTNCDVVTGTFMTRDADSVFVLTNTKLISQTTTNGSDEGNYNDGVITLINSILTYSAQLTNNGTINLDINSCLTAPSIVGTGKIVIDVTGIGTTPVTVINADMSGFTGTIELTGGNAEYESTESGVVVSKTLAGSGTEADPFVIGTVDDLFIFAQMVNAGETFAGQYVKLTQSIDLGTTVFTLRTATANWTAIGTKDNPFKGTFDGNNETISNLIVVGEANQGFFGYATEATIKNVKIENVTVIGTDCVGAIVGQGYASTYIDNCHLSGNIQISGYTNVGGIVGKYYARVTNCSVIGDGIETSFVEGIYLEADLEGDNVGGIMGHAGENNNHSGNTVKNITISGTRKVGGLIGTTDRATDLTGCTVENVLVKSTATSDYVAANTATATIGGLIGNYYGGSTGGTVTECTVKSITFDKGNALYAGPIVGGNRTTPGEAPAGVTTDANVVELATITGANNYYLMTIVAQIGDNKYLTLAEALAAAVEDDTVVLLEDVTLDAVLTIEKSITLDLGGKTLTGADGAIVINVKADTTIKNGTIVGNKSGTSSGLIDIYANLTMNGVTVETSEILALRFKAGGYTATLTECNVTGAFKGYGSSVWNIVSGTYKASSTSLSDQLNGTAQVSGGTFYYAINEVDCAPGYAVVVNEDGTYTVKYAPVGFIDANNNGTLDDGEVIFANLDQVFETYKEGNVYVVLTDNAVANGRVDTDADAHYYINTNVADGVTVDFLYADDWNYVQNMTIGENVTLNSKYLLLWNNVNINGTVETDYLYMFGATVVVGENGNVKANTGDATVQVKDGTTFTVNGTVDTSTLNVWVNDAKLVVSGENAQVNASWIEIWDGTPTVTVENGATLDVDAIKASRGGEITVNGATLEAESIELGHNGESVGKLTESGDSTINGEIKLTVEGSTVSSDGGLNVTTNIADHKVVYENGEYVVVPCVYVAQIGDAKYESLAEAIAALKDSDTLTIFAGEYSEGTIKFPATLNNVTIKGEDGAILKDMTLMASDGSNIAYTGITFDNITFENSNILFTGQRTSATFKDWTIKNCTFNNVARGYAAISFNLNTSEAMENFTFTGNTINGVTGGNYSGLVLRASKGTVVVTDNNVQGAAWNAIQLINSSAETLTIENNTFASGADEGILNLYGVTATTLSVKNNKFLVTEGQAGICYLPAGDVSENYWGGNAPANLPEGVTCKNYYADAELTTLVTITYVAQVGDNKYISLQDAFDAAQDGNTITLIDNAVVDNRIDLYGKNVTLDLNGKKITPVEGASMTAGIIRVKEGGTLTINDSVGGGEINYNGETKVYAALGVIGPDATLTVNGGKIVGYYYGIAGNGSTDGTTITINDGDVSSAEGTGSGIYHPQSGTLTINGGTITGATGVYFKSGTLVITGGTIIGNGAKKDYGYVVSGADATGDALVIENVGVITGYEPIVSVSITGGTFESTNANAVASYAATITNPDAVAVTGFISGGTFSSDVSAYCTPLYKCVANEDGTYGVEKIELLEITEFETSLILGSDFQMSFYMPTKYFVEGVNYYAMITKHHANGCGDSDVIVYVPIDTTLVYDSTTYGECYKVIARNIVAKEMNCEISCQVFAGTMPEDGAENTGVSVSGKATDSIVAYAKYMLENNTTDEKLQTLIVDMLNYGAAAQTYFGHYTDCLANNILTDEQKASSVLSSDYVYQNITKMYGDQVEKFSGTYSSITLDSSIFMNFYLKGITADELANMNVVVSFTHHSGKVHEVIYNVNDAEHPISIDENGLVKIVVDDLTPADAAIEVFCKVYNGEVSEDNLVLTVVDSIESYCGYQVQNAQSDNLKDVCQKIVKYSKSAYAYFHPEN